MVVLEHMDWWTEQNLAQLFAQGVGDSNSAIHIRDDGINHVLQKFHSFNATVLANFDEELGKIAMDRSDGKESTLLTSSGFAWFVRTARIIMSP